MRNVYVLLLFQLLMLSVQAQTLTTCDSAKLDCSLDLRSPIFNDVVTTAPISYAKNPLPSLFTDVQYKSDVYDPVQCPAPTTMARRCFIPLLIPRTICTPNALWKPVILMHAGSFAECSSYDQPNIKNMAEQLAMKGFVVYNVEYRRGIRPDSANGLYTSAQQQLAVYCAIQDIRGFFRSMIKRERNKSSFGDYWRVDTSNIFIGGFSAGALAALSVAWYTNSMIDSLYSPPVTASNNISYALGSPDADYYYGDSDFDFHTFYQPKIKGVCSMWGAISMPAQPYSDTTKQPYFFTNAHLTPAILFSGYKDKTFPFINRAGFTQNIYLSPSMPTSEQIYNSVSYCSRSGMGPFTVDATGTTADFVNGSSNNMYKILNYYSLKCEIYLDCGMAHGLDDNCGGCPQDPTNLAKNKKCKACAYGSDFGTGATDQEQTINYMASRIAVFFQKILHPIQSSFGNTIFVECVNDSHNCGANSANCTNRACNGQVLDF